jgi:hypothetical protein
MKHLTQEEFDRLTAEAAEGRRLTALVNTPELLDFQKAVLLEAAHQVERFGSEHDGGKTPEDWFWLIGYLAGRALEHHKEAERLAAIDNDIARDFREEQIAYHREKAVHHCITTAAACANWHLAVVGKVSMRPGVDPATIVAAAGEVV